MKNFRLKSVFVVLFLATALISCSNDDDEPRPNPVVRVASVTAIDGPATGKVDQELSYDITFVADNACAEFSKFNETVIDDVKGLQVEVKYPSEVCTLQVPNPKKTVYKFKSSIKGTFEFKFKKSDKEFVTKKVVIE